MIDNREAIWFKQVPEGYVFRAPRPWVFGPAKYFLVNEAQKAKLLGILAVRSQFATAMILLAAVTVTFAGSAAILVFLSNHGVTGASLVVTTAALTLLSLYVALLFCLRPIALLVQRHLPDLTPTDQRIAAADIRAATQKTVWVPGQLMLAASHALLSAVFFMQAMQRTHGHLLSAIDNLAASSALFAGGCFAFAAASLLVSALKKFMQARDETAQAELSPKKWRLPAFSLAIAVLAAGMTIYAGHIEAKTEAAAAQRREKSFEISQRLGVLAERVNKSTAARAAMKARVAANSARMNALIDKLNHPAVKCEPAVANDDPARQQSARDCAERARQEKQAIEAQIGTTTKEAAALAKENAALEKETADIKTELAAVQVEMDANR